jgi:hypothetical protein
MMKGAQVVEGRVLEDAIISRTIPWRISIGIMPARDVSTARFAAPILRFPLH